MAQKVSLTAFMPKAVSGLSWADDEAEPEVEEAPPPPPPPPSAAPPSYASAPAKPLPTSGPFVCFVGNLSFDAGKADLERTFQDCGITDFRPVRNKDNRVVACFLDLADAEGLRKALALDGELLCGRAMRVDVGESRNDRGGGGACARAATRACARDASRLRAARSRPARPR